MENEMKNFEKIKIITEWIVSIILKLRLRKTYWSIAVPIGLFVFGEFAKNLGFIIKVTDRLYSETDNLWIKLVLKAINFYYTIKLPWWSLFIIIVILLFFSFIYLKELKAKKNGIEISAETITNSIFRKLTEKIDAKFEELKSGLTFNPKDSWYNKQCNSAIDDLGNRYTPELNFELEVSRIFDGLGRNSNFKNEISEKVDKVLIEGKKILKDKPELNDVIKKLEHNFDKLEDLFNSIDFCSTTNIPFEKFEEILNNSNNLAEKVDEFYSNSERKIQEEKNDYKFYHKYGYELRNIRDFEYEIISFIKYINGITCKLANNPFLLLDGEAGIGKSHLIGDIVSKRMKSEYKSVFFLGQHFLTDEDPWTQIFKKLQINTNADSFLSILNDEAKKSGKRLIIFVDAINEGRGRYFWNNYIRSFIEEIKQYNWLGLVITIRTSYKTIIFPADELKRFEINEHTLWGFRNVEYDASKLFFKNYNIELPNVPLLHPEFQNPLFLKLFCDGISKSGLNRIPDGLQGISKIMNFFINSINEVLSKPKRLDYSNSLNLVQKSINALILFKIDNKVRYIPYEKAYLLVDESIEKYIDKKGFIEELIKEGVLSKNLFWKSDNEHEDGVYLAYERFEDHIMSQFLLEKYHDFDIEFKDGGNLFPYVKDEQAIYMNRGLIDAFSIQIPEITGKEFFEYIPHLKDKYPIIESFLDSIIWRKIETINNNSKDFVNEYVFKYQDTFDLFWEVNIAVAGIPNHYFNAYSLHNYLIKFSLADRDAVWTPLLKYKFDNNSSVKRLIDWSWNIDDKSHISDESIKLSSITLAWFHTSTNRQLRDYSTKALICLLKDRLNILLELLIMFENVNDPYVYERLFAVAYGCVLRNQESKELVKLSEYIYKTVFDNEKEVYAHILLRDYARGVIEYAHHLKCELSFEISKVRPPYKSSWPETIATVDELESKYKNDNYRNIWSSVMSFGDFARYTIGTNSNLSEWSGFKFEEKPIDREEILENFLGKLNEEQLSKYYELDPIITEDKNDVFEIGNSKIKYSVAVGRKSENELKKIKKEFKKSLAKEKKAYYEKEIEPYLDENHNIINTGKNFDLRIAQRIIFSRVIELGWDPELHLSFDDEIGTGRGRSTNPHERIGKKYQWIAYYEYLARLSDNFIKYDRWNSDEVQPYEGPWEPYVRDIDPTLLISKTGTYNSEEPTDFWWSSKKSFNWNCSNEDWVNDSNELPDFKNLIQVKDSENTEWLILEGYPKWFEPKKIGKEKWYYPQKELWCQIRSYLVHEKDFSRLKEWAIKKDFMGRWMPESVDRYEVFNREYYWSPAYKYFMKEYYGGEEWKEIYDKKTGKLIAPVIVTAENYLWEEEFDNSKEHTISFLKPCVNIFRGMDLKFSDKEGEFINNSNEVNCFATNVYNNSKQYLLVKKEPFVKYLKTNNLKILWTVLGEKQIIGGRTLDDDYIGRLEYSGAYYFENMKLKGSFNTKSS